MKFIISFMLCMSIGGLECARIRYDNYKLFQIIPRSIRAVKFLHDLELSETPDFDFWNSVGPVGAPVDVMVPPYKVNSMKDMIATWEMDAKILMENVQAEIDSQQQPQLSGNGNFGWARYNTLDEINNWLKNLSVTHAPVVTLIEGGRSYEGRTIYGVRVSYSPDNFNNSVFLESSIHANEWITSAVSTYILNELLTSTDPTVRYVAESHDWYVFPVFNPDGLVHAHTVDRLWRKTRVPHGILCIGADPNRNWDHHWNSGGSSNLRCSPRYHGPEPFSEPCCRSLSNFITSISDRLVGYISFHSFLQYLLLPYGYTDEHLDNYDQMYEIGVKSVEVLAQRYGTEYVVGTTNDIIYPASGTSADWVKGTFKTPIVYTYELRDRGQYGFLLPPEQIISTAEETLDSFVTIFIEYEKSLKRN